LALAGGVGAGGLAIWRPWAEPPYFTETVRGQSQLLLVQDGKQRDVLVDLPRNLLFVASAERGIHVSRRHARDATIGCRADKMVPLDGLRDRLGFFDGADEVVLLPIHADTARRVGAALRAAEGDLVKLLLTLEPGLTRQQMGALCESHAGATGE
jgi:hypothetical protein